jgi:hypothetical protein
MKYCEASSCRVVACKCTDTFVTTALASSMTSKLILTLTVVLLYVTIGDCITNYAPGVNDGMSRNELIVAYFDLGYSYKEIVAALALIHSVTISLRHLKRILSRLSKHRKLGINGESPLEEVIEAMLTELRGSGKCLGYKAMWCRLMKGYGLSVKRKTVWELLWLMDPEGMENRKAKRLTRRVYTVPGPNFLWHIDGYDKLKPFGLAIHGCIDGYSRRIMWLEVGSSNNDPNVISKYFLDCIESLQIVPTIIRSDMGTENTSIKLLQMYLRSRAQDRFAGANSFIVGKSTSNQRIEAWWCILRKQGVQFWMDFFKDLRALDLYRDDIYHQECVRLCFMGILHDELQCIVKDWNTHTIHSKKGAESPSGKPDVMFTMPELYDTKSYHQTLDNDNLDELKEQYAMPRHDRTCHPVFLELCKRLVPGMQKPSSLGDAIDLYGNLIVKLREALVASN